MLDYPNWTPLICYKRIMVMINKGDSLTKAKYVEWQASLFGACFIAVAIGVLFADTLKQFVSLLILVGISLHGWGMYCIHRRNN